MGISLIVAMDTNGGIGKDNQLLWHMPSDLRFFKEKTMGKTVVMGRKTAESIGRALPGRKNVVLTRTGWHQEGFNVQTSVQEILDYYKDEEVVIIGGAEIYKQFLPYVDTLIITHVWEDFEADTFFPEFEWQEWKLVQSSGFILSTPTDPHCHSFITYKRRT
jgi:dihydrofolate reductase